MENNTALMERMSNIVFNWNRLQPWTSKKGISDHVFRALVNFIISNVCRANGTLWRRSGAKWEELCTRADDDYVGLEEDILCQQFNFTRVLKKNLISSTKLVDNNYSTIRLNNGREIELRNYRQRITNVTEECTTWNLLCE